MNVFWIALIIWTIIFGFYLLKFFSRREPRFHHKSRIIGNFREGGWLLIVAFSIVDLGLSTVTALTIEFILNAK